MPACSGLAQLLDSKIFRHALHRSRAPRALSRRQDCSGVPDTGSLLDIRTDGLCQQPHPFLSSRALACERGRERGGSTLRRKAEFAGVSAGSGAPTRRRSYQLSSPIRGSADRTVMSHSVEDMLLSGHSSQRIGPDRGSASRRKVSPKGDSYGVSQTRGPGVSREAGSDRARGRRSA